VCPTHGPCPQPSFMSVLACRSGGCALHDLRPFFDQHCRSILTRLPPGPFRLACCGTVSRSFGENASRRARGVRPSCTPARMARALHPPPVKVVVVPTTLYLGNSMSSATHLDHVPTLPVLDPMPRSMETPSFCCMFGSPTFSTMLGTHCLSSQQ